MTHPYIAENRDLLTRFSCSLLLRGKKAVAYRRLLESLLIWRQNTGKSMLSTLLPKQVLTVNKYFSVSRSALKSIKKALNSERKNSLTNNTKDALSFTQHNAVPAFSAKASLDSSKDTPVVASLQEEKRENGSQNNRCKIRYKRNNKKASVQPQSIFDGDGEDLLLSALKASIALPSSGNDTTLCTKTISNASLLSNSDRCAVCIENVKPMVETRKVRKGRITYRVPLLSKVERQQGKAIYILIENARSESKTFSPSLSDKKSGVPASIVKLQNRVYSRTRYGIPYTLANVFSDAFDGKGESVSRKRKLHRIALQNKGYAHFRWW